MDSASIPDSIETPLLARKAFFFLTLLLNAERESAPMTNVGDHETNRLLEETRLNSEPVFYQFTTSIEFDQ